MTTLAMRFAASVIRHGEACALEVAGTKLSYRELNARAEQLARQIVAACGEPPSRVGLLAERSVPAYAGYLAAQRLGATVIPLNPTSPAARTNAVVAAAAPDLVVTDIDLDDEYAWDVPVLRASDSTIPAPLPPLPDDQDAIAYLLFTSGSTGRPKGVPVRHRSVAAYLDHVIDRYGLGPGCRLSQNFSLTFDLSVFDMYAAWGSGASLVVPSRDDLLAPVRYVRNAQITHWFSVPSAISLARRSRRLTPGCMPDLRWSLFCGEQLTVQQALAWQAAAPNSAVENLYGPTELTISCTEYRLPPGPDHWIRGANGSVAIGTPYDHMEYLVIDDQGAVALDGELCMRGVQRFPGYLDPSDNDASFFRFDGRRAHVYRDAAAPDGDLWYRTGDRVTIKDGLLIHLGRLDHQVKIRGHRVELGEIEAVLREQSGVDDAVVVATPGDDELTLHAVCTGAADTRQLTRALRRVLPAYMVPRSTTFVDELPLNANGKVDRPAAAHLSLAAAAPSRT